MLAGHWQLLLMLVTIFILGMNIVYLSRSKRQLIARLESVERKLSVRIRKRNQMQTSTIESIVLKDTLRTSTREYMASEAYISLIDAIKPKEPLPATRGWAASPDFLKHIYTEVRQRKPSVVMELGGGVSTLVVAYALAKNGTGRLVSIDHDENYSAKTLEQLRLHEMDHLVDQIVAPLEKYAGKEDVMWYGGDAIKSVSNVDMLLVDGPPGIPGKKTRLPAVRELKSHLTESAVIFLDDGIRNDEKQIASIWEKELDCSADYLWFDKGLFVFDLAA